MWLKYKGKTVWNTKKEDYLLFIINPDMMPELCRLFTTALPLSGVVRGAAKDPQLLAMLRGLAQMHTQENHPYYDVILKGQMLSFFGERLFLWEYVYCSH